MKLSDMTKDERSLLLYLETCAVDNGGLVNSHRMNVDDIALAKEWSLGGFIQFGRVYSGDIIQSTHWCKLSGEAMHLAHEERTARAERMWDNRTWRSTEEKRNER